MQSKVNLKFSLYKLLLKEKQSHNVKHFIIS